MVDYPEGGGEIRYHPGGLLDMLGVPCRELGNGGEYARRQLVRWAFRNQPKAQRIALVFHNGGIISLLTFVEDMRRAIRLGRWHDLIEAVS
jgi:hypothetical protein